MRTLVKMAILTFLFKSSFTWQKASLMKIKEICSVDLISVIDNESISDEIIKCIVPGGDLEIECRFVNNKKIIQIWMPVQILETPEHDFSCIAN